ncbi:MULTISPECIES: urease accessory UreF family protein [Rhodomicrobium]|uniref:urease accessory protein UreF n=1 Tax=Rhodomicrobium TaxID=1068 RepID=UPI001FD8D6E6|nr:MULTISPECIES: urease accessory UreF family protein [Rhodomicrobium]
MATATAIIITTVIMSIDAVKLLRLQSWLSPAFPTGAFSYSHALEWAVEDGTVTDRAALVDWLDADIRHGSGRSDAILLACAHRALALPGLDDFLAVAELAGALRATSEFALEAGQQGTAFLSTIRKAWPGAALDAAATALAARRITPALPIATAIACAAHAIPLSLALPAYLHATAANLVNAAVRLVPLGQTDGQIAIAALEPAIIDTAREAEAARLDEIGSAAFTIDIASMRHETQYTRLFRS